MAVVAVGHIMQCHVSALFVCICMCKWGTCWRHANRGWATHRALQLSGVWLSAWGYATSRLPCGPERIKQYVVVCLRKEHGVGAMQDRLPWT